MANHKKIEIQDFTICYNGIYTIKFEYQNKLYREYVYITPNMLFKLIENEKLDDKNLNSELLLEGINFTKTSIYFNVFEDSNGEIGFITSELADVYQEFSIYMIEFEIEK